jgi:5-methylcytosine-specific restriction endonuclease McrA
MVIVKCVICGNEFEAIRTSAKYCSKKCSRKAENMTDRAKKARSDYYYRHKEKISQKSKERRENYSEEKKKEIKEREKAYYAQNRERCLSRNKKWIEEYRKTEKGKYMQRMYVHQRRLIVESLEKVDYNLLKEKFDKLGNKCVVCGSCENLTIDHIIPITKGGTNDICNLQPMCKSCNSAKNNKTMEEFLQYLEYKRELKK